MGIGAITAFRPYYYNTNTLSANSLNPITAIDDEDLTKNRIDQTGLQQAYAETVNPLSRGETADYQVPEDTTAVFLESHYCEDVKLFYFHYGTLLNGLPEDRVYNTNGL